MAPLPERTDEPRRLQRGTRGRGVLCGAPNSSQGEAAAAANIGSGGALASAGYVRVQSGTTGTAFSSGTNRNHGYNVAYEWQVYNLYCTNSITGAGYYSGKYEWRPYKATGGNSVSALSGTFACYSYGGSQPQSISYPVQVSRSATNSWSAGVSWSSTLNLASKQTNSTSHVLTYTPTSTTKLCGNTSNVLADAKSVRETS